MGRLSRDLREGWYPPGLSRATQTHAILPRVRFPRPTPGVRNDERGDHLAQRTASVDATQGLQYDATLYQPGSPGDEGRGEFART